MASLAEEFGYLGRILLEQPAREFGRGQTAEDLGMALGRGMPRGERHEGRRAPQVARGGERRHQFHARLLLEKQGRLERPSCEGPGIGGGGVSRGIGCLIAMHEKVTG
ncbi:hypothetical protein DWF04_021695 [Cereibacter sphaeroides f. sp. denitrificans]